MHHSRLIGLGLCAAGMLCHLPAYAGGWYIGSGVGLSKGDLETAFNEGVGTAWNQISLDDQDTGWKLFGGYALSDLLSAELSYVNLGTQSASTQVGGVSLDADAKTSGFALSAVAGMNVLPGFGVHARAGVYRWDTDISALVRQAVTAVDNFSVSEDGTDLTFGVGLHAEFGPLGARLEWERFQDLADANYDLYTVSVFYQF